MERPTPRALAWGAVVGGVTAYDLLCPKGQTMSEAVDVGLETKYKRLIQIGIGVTALHLINVLPDAIDPLHQLTRIKAERGDRT